MALFFINGKFNSIQNLDMRMFFPQELDSYLEWNGFHIIHKYGGFEEEAFNDNSAKTDICLPVLVRILRLY